MRGESPSSPQRWFVCVRGIEPKGSPPKSRSIPDRIEMWIDLPIAGQQYDVIVIFLRGLRSAVVEGFESRLCKHATFKPLALRGQRGSIAVENEMSPGLMRRACGDALVAVLWLKAPRIARKRMRSPDQDENDREPPAIVKIVFAAILGVMWLVFMYAIFTGSPHV